MYKMGYHINGSYALLLISWQCIFINILGGNWLKNPPLRTLNRCSANWIFEVMIARRFHLFPFRTEKLSFVTPMVLQTCGRVGSRHFMEDMWFSYPPYLFLDKLHTFDKPFNKIFRCGFNYSPSPYFLRKGRFLTH